MSKPIINGIDVSECCCFENNRCLWSKRYYENNNVAPLCEEVKNCYFKQRKRLQEELDIKEKMLDKFMIGSGEILEKLQKENEELKNKIDIYENSIIANHDRAVGKRLMEVLLALEEIREKLKKYDANIGDTIIANPIQDCYDTYKLISEVLKCQ